MAAPSYTTDLTDIFAPTTPTTTGWTALGGGASGLNADTDYYIHGTGATTKNAWAGAIKGMIYNAGATTITAGDVVFMWITHLTPPSLDTEAGGGIRVLIGSGTGAYYEYFVAGSDVWIYDERWLCAVVDPRTGTVAPDATTGSPAGTSYFGGQADLPSGGPTKGAPFAVNAIRHGRSLIITDGDVGNGYATFAGAAQENDYNDGTNGYNRWGLFQFSGGTYKQQGLFQMGTSGTSVDFRDANRNIVVARTPKVYALFNGFEVVNAASNVEWTNISIVALGSTSPGYFTAVDNATILLDGCTFVDMGAFTFLSNTSALDCTFRRCEAVDAGGADLTGSLVTNPDITTDTSAVVWDVATDTDGLLDNMTFVKGTAVAHAIELGTTSPTTVTLRGITFSGYNAANAQNDSAILVSRTSGSVTINAIGCTGTVSYKSAGATVTVVQDPVTTLVTVRDVDTGSVIQDARVYIEADTGGPLSVGTVIINALTNSLGQVSDTRTLASDQPITGWVRKGTSSPLYKQGNISATIDSVNGVSFTVQLVPDE